MVEILQGRETDTESRPNVKTKEHHALLKEGIHRFHNNQNHNGWLINLQGTSLRYY